MEVNTKACNQCARLKQETNHWFKVYTTPLSTAILFAPAAEPIDPAGYVEEDICGQECLHKRLNAWIGSTDLLRNHSPLQESVTA